MELTFTDSYRKLLEQISDTYRDDGLERKFYEKQALPNAGLARTEAGI